MSNWKTAYRSFYYETAELPEDIELSAERTALLVLLLLAPPLNGESAS